MKAKYCMYCGHNLEDNDKLEGCCMYCAERAKNLETLGQEKSKLQEIKKELQEIKEAIDSA